jgi:hypothetical protein
VCVHRFPALALLLATAFGASSAAQQVGERSVRAHMAFLAGDSLNGRGSGTRDERIAASYVAAHFERLGLKPLGSGGFVHEVRIERSELSGPPTVTIGTHRLTHGKEILVTSLGAPKIAGPLQKYRPGEAVKPGVVLLLRTTIPPSAAETAPAALVLSIETGAQQKRRLAGGAGPGPQLRVQWIVDTPRRGAVALEKGTWLLFDESPEGAMVTLEAETKPSELGRTWNVAAQLTGRRRPGELIVLSAHHDHVGSRGAAQDTDTIYNGADDDASGTIAVLELAEALSSRPAARTIVFATFGSEETGGQGSSHFIEASGLRLEQIVANLQFEMIGRPDPKVPANTLWLTGFERSDLGETLARRGARLVADPHPEQNFFTRSDNIRFARRGVVAHTVSSYGLHQQYHQPSDEYDTIDFAHMTRAIQSMVEPIRWLANASFRPRWKEGMRP